MTDQPTYYAIIPANVRYDKNLTPNAKLLYGEITALSNKWGYCIAKNSYFAEVYGVHKRKIREWLQNLKEAGYIYVESCEAGKSTRKIWIKEKIRGAEIGPGVGRNRPPHNNNTPNTPEDEEGLTPKSKKGNKNADQDENEPDQEIDEFTFKTAEKLIEMTEEKISSSEALDLVGIVGPAEFRRFWDRFCEKQKDDFSRIKSLESVIRSKLKQIKKYKLAEKKYKKERKE